MAKNYLTNKGPLGLLDMEMIVLLGVLLLDSKQNRKLFNKPNNDQAQLESNFTVMLDRALNKRGYTNSGSGQFLFWKNRGNAAKAGLKDLLKWVVANQNDIKDLRDSLQAFLENEYQNSNPYGQCDFSPEEVMDLFEAGRIIRYRTR